MNCKIQGPTVDNEILYWSNVNGWVDEQSATIFKREQILSLPIEATKIVFLNKFGYIHSRRRIIKSFRAFFKSFSK